MRSSTRGTPALLTLLVLVAGCAGAGAEPGAVRRIADDTVEFDAVVSASTFGGEAEMSGYHLVVWRDGGAADHALFVAEVTDVQVLDALEELGAVPGNALGNDTWDERHDADARAPDKVIAGPPVRIEIHTAGDAAPLALSDFLVDPGAEGFTMRFGGHRANIPAWHSGCLVCLYSCPGSKVGNAAYTVRDFVQGATHFDVRPGVLPPDGKRVRIRLVLEPETSS